MKNKQVHLFPFLLWKQTGDALLPVGFSKEVYN